MFDSSRLKSSNWQYLNDAQIAKFLQIKQSDVEDFYTVKHAFRKQMIRSNHNSSKRINLNNAYVQATRKIFSSDTNQIIYFINNKNEERLRKIFDRDASLIDKKIHQYPPIYYAVRSGHYSIVEYLLKKGCFINFSGHRSTPMHAAAYFGQYSIIPLLLSYGIPTDIKNFQDNLPQEQAATDDIENLLKEAHKNKINLLQERILNLKLIAVNLQIFDHKKQLIAKKIILHRYCKNYPYSSFEDVFHGTRYEVLQSIAKNGLRKPGDIVDGKKIKPIQGHISENIQLEGKKNWAKAIFVSPSIYYAAHPVYCQEFITNKNETWLPIVQAKVKKGSFTKHDHTLAFYKIHSNQPTTLEFRVEEKLPQKSPKQLVYRGQQSENIHVVALIFLRKGYLDNHSDYLQTTQLMLNSKEEILVRGKLF